MKQYWKSRFIFITNILNNDQISWIGRTYNPCAPQQKMDRVWWQDSNAGQQDPVKMMICLM